MGKFVDIGRIWDLPRVAEGNAMGVNIKPQRSYDSISVQASDFPKLAKAGIGEEFDLIARCRKTGMSEDTLNGKKVTMIRIEIHKLAEEKEGEDFAKQIYK
jgi:hypothetical protein